MDDLAIALGVLALTAATAVAWLSFVRSDSAFARRPTGRLARVVAAAVVVAVAIALAAILHGVRASSGLAQWDRSAAESARAGSTAVSIDVWSTLTHLGDVLVVFPVMALIGVVHALRRSDVGPLVYLAAVGVGVAFVNNLLKLSVGRERPSVAPLIEYSGSSFPSGHTAAAAACWAAIACVVTRRGRLMVRVAAGACAISVAGVVATSRVVLGVHWVSDVVAGLLVGWGCWVALTALLGGRTLGLELSRRDPIDDPTHDSTNGRDLRASSTRERHQPRKASI